MTHASTDLWIVAVTDSIASYRRMIDATLEQLSDSELHAHPEPHINSVAILLRHLGGNLCSRWTDFFTTDGEKPDRDRDSEFRDWEGDRDSLITQLDAGWDALTSTIHQINDSNISEIVHIRGKPHTIAQALTRSLTHLAYHVGQILIVARMVHEGPWNWLTIPPGESAQHNERTWGTDKIP